MDYIILIIRYLPKGVAYLVKFCLRFVLTFVNQDEPRMSTRSLVKLGVVAKGGALLIRAAHVVG